MSDVKFLLVMICLFLATTITVLVIGIVAISDNQRAQICLEYTTYPPCAAWGAP